MQHVTRPSFICPAKPENLTVFENGVYCNGCGQPVVHFDGADKAEVLKALHLYSQTPCITVSQKGTDVFRPFP